MLNNLLSSLFFKIKEVRMCGNELLATGAEDGCLRVWAIKQREQTLQFQVLNQVPSLFS